MAPTQDINSLADKAQLEEELLECSADQVEADELYQAEIKNAGMTGMVTAVDIGAESGERLYLIEYSDGDVEHMTADIVRKNLVQLSAKGKKGTSRKEDSDNEDNAKPRKGVQREPRPAKKEIQKAKKEVKLAVALKKPAAKAPKAAAMKAAPKAKAKKAPPPMKGEKASMKVAPMKAVKKAAAMKAMKSAMKAKPMKAAAMKVVKKTKAKPKAKKQK